MWLSEEADLCSSEEADLAFADSELARSVAEAIALADEARVTVADAMDMTTESDAVAMAMLHERIKASD